ncbi:cellulose biosynthesis cyclic di-GMP-binding regulatory protein BcsB [Oceanisphaera arctica]|uniref:Cyclic di-GMP-binding protein n=1 Tax=Oceanisphaera arctica TaxID=641510 RepID=A0A2P5TPR1_9GAMM|nr:cellulose biosynthesis cyclic di-GMP-binding regulatory protein BcsB [Oceanisphaera arctica]PPL17602.1 cellulose synthase regulator BcsB [Oceanisphaera arctica]GHA15975.1 cellulose synthase regulator BcsB [Oceanisphaera arctica]
MIKRITLFILLAGSITAPIQAEESPVETTLTVLEEIPARDVELTFGQLTPSSGNLILRGNSPEGQVEFGVRSDEVVSSALLDLDFIPSPALLPVESQVKVYLNDEMMGVVPVANEQLGNRSRVQVPLDPRYIGDFNRVKLDFIGHYQRTCENPAHSSLWLDVGSGSKLSLRYQALPLKNDLSYFPEPFFDSRDNRPLTLPMVFAASPALAQHKAAAVLASWFGARAQWRGQQFPVLFNQLPERHGIVFATNEQRPEFLREYPAVDGPTVEMISHPENPYVKLLLVLGRDDEDLITAVRGIAQGSILFRGQSVSVADARPLMPRQPYDAPNWVRTDRPVAFTELQNYPDQLQATGMEPSPMSLTLNLPPDLYMARDLGIAMQLKYRYTSPKTDDGSRLTVSLNDQFLRTYTLKPERQSGEKLLQLRLLQDASGNDRLTIPALKLGTSNQLRFNFDYANAILGGTPERCETYQQIPNQVVIDGHSTIDFSGYRHFIAMPDLRAFANAGFPFSRLADLSQTLVVVDKHPAPAQISALLNILGAIGAHTGYPALGVRLSDDWQQEKNRDLDLLLVGSIPASLRDDKNIHLLFEATRSRVQMPARQVSRPELMPDSQDDKPASEARIDSDGPMAAVIGFQSPFHEQRSVVALLADSPRGYQLLNEAINDSGQRAALSGTVAVIRESGVKSLRVGKAYHVGYLPWWERIWFVLAPHPLVLAGLTAFSVLLLAWVLWRLLRAIGRRRLSPDERD